MSKIPEIQVATFASAAAKSCVSPCASKAPVKALDRWPCSNFMMWTQWVALQTVNCAQNTFWRSLLTPPIQVFCMPGSNTYMLTSCARLANISEVQAISQSISESVVECKISRRLGTLSSTRFLTRPMPCRLATQRLSIARSHVQLCWELYLEYGSSLLTCT